MAIDINLVLLFLITSGAAHLPPLKVVTILSGVLHVNLLLFFVAAVDRARRQVHAALLAFCEIRRFDPRLHRKTPQSPRRLGGGAAHRCLSCLSAAEIETPMTTSSLAVPAASRPILWPAHPAHRGHGRRHPLRALLRILSRTTFPARSASCSAGRYYIGIPIGMLAVLSSAVRAPPPVTRLRCFLLPGSPMLIGRRHGRLSRRRGVEVLGRPFDLRDLGRCRSRRMPASLFDAINTQHGPSCTDASLRVLGLSFAGWNVITSLVLARDRA